jgi:hypothetical protein
MMHEFISSEEKYHKPGHMDGYADLCDWCNIGISKLCQVHDLSNTTSRVRCMKLRATYIDWCMHFCYCHIYILVYELLLLSYIDWCINFCYCHIVI